VELVDAQAGVRAAAKAATLVRQLPQPLGFSLMILETKKMTFGLFLAKFRDHGHEGRKDFRGGTDRPRHRWWQSA